MTFTAILVIHGVGVGWLAIGLDKAECIAYADKVTHEAFVSDRAHLTDSFPAVVCVPEFKR